MRDVVIGIAKRLKLAPSSVRLYNGFSASQIPRLKYSSSRAAEVTLRRPLAPDPSALKLRASDESVQVYS